MHATGTKRMLKNWKKILIVVNAPKTPSLLYTNSMCGVLYSKRARKQNVATPGVQPYDLVMIHVPSG